MNTAVLEVTNVRFGDTNAANFANTHVTAIAADVTFPYSSNPEFFEFISQTDGSPSVLTVKPANNETMNRIIYHMRTTEYLFIGIAAVRNSNDSGNTVGRAEFPEVTISRDDHGSQLAITNRCSIQSKWTFGLAIQRVSDGAFGILDPEIDNNPSEGSGG